MLLMVESTLVSISMLVLNVFFKTELRNKMDSPTIFGHLVVPEFEERLSRFGPGWSRIVVEWSYDPQLQIIPPTHRILIE